MGLWAGIKYALNSTLGTPNFLPLNKIIEQQFTIVASDEMYASLENLSVKIPEGEKASKIHPQKFKMLRSGELIFKGQFNAPDSLSSSTLKIYINGVATNVINRTGVIDFSKKFTFKANDEIYFEISGANNSVRDFNVSISNCSLCGTVKPAIYEII